MCGPSFSFVGLSVPEKREMKLFDIWKLERKKNEEIKGRINRRSLVLFHIKQQMIHNICTKLQNSMCNSSWEIFVTNFPIYITLEREMEKVKRRQNKSQQFCFLSQYTWPLSMCIQNLKTLALTEDEKFVAENLLGQKEKWTNKGNHKQLHADSLLHNTTSHTQNLYQLSKS